MPSVETVRGPVDVDALGVTLMHEHVFVLTPDVMQNYGDEWWDEEERVADAITNCEAHRETGVPITAHTIAAHQTGRLALELYAKEGVDLTKVVVGHAGDTNDLDYLE